MAAEMQLSKTKRGIFMKPGGWNIDGLQACKLPEEVEDGFKEVTGNLYGVGYEPLLLAGTQVVDGMNYRIICRQRLVIKEPESNLVIMIINKNRENKWIMLSLERV